MVPDSPVYQGKRFQESTGSKSKTIAKEYEKRRKAEMERAAAGMPTDPKSSRIRTVTEIIRPYLEGYKLNHRPKSGYIRQRQGDSASGCTINMELGELSRAYGQPWSLLWPKVRKMEERKDVGRALSPAEQNRLLDGLKDRRTPHLPTLIPMLLLTGMRAGEALSVTWGQVNPPKPLLSPESRETKQGDQIGIRSVILIDVIS